MLGLLTRILFGCCLVVAVKPMAWAQLKIRDEPIRYYDTAAENRVSKLFERIHRGEVVLDHGSDIEFLRSLLDALDIDVSSQVLAFSKTSLQARLISPDNPRATYFNDDVYVAWVRGSSLLEISTTDDRLGAAFYTVRMSPDRPTLRLETTRCLMCHKLPMTKGIPGHVVRSVLTRPDGRINSLERSFVSGHESRIADRWGGWYVTGHLGGMQHMGNAFLRDGELVPIGQPHRIDLRDDVDASAWLTPFSDVVALMVLEHQTQMQNTFTLADFEVRRAAYERNFGGTVDSGPAGASSAVTQQDYDAVVDRSAKQIVDYLLFAGEAALHAEVRGTSGFVSDFAARGSFDERGRSLREFDLKRRMFRYPCSYLIYSSAFDGLDESLRQRVYRRLWRVLTQRDDSSEYDHIDGSLSDAILTILRQTKPGLPDYWFVDPS